MGSIDRKTSSIGRPSSAWTVLLMTSQGTFSSQQSNQAFPGGLISVQTKQTFSQAAL